MEKERALLTLAVKQGGIVLRSQAMEAGVSTGTIDRRLASGRWTCFAKGAYRLLPLESELDVLRAAVTVLPAAVVSHGSAARLHGLDPANEGRPTVLVHTKTTHSFPGVTVRRCHDLADSHVDVAEGLRVTTTARTIVDLAGVAPVGVVARTLDSALTTGLTTLDQVDAVLHDVARRGKPGVVSIRTLIAERTGQDHSGSVLEARANKMVLDAGLDAKLEYPIPWDRSRRFDVAFPDHRLAVEWDSRSWHTQMGAFESDRQRDRDAVVHGWRVLRFTWSDVNNRPRHVISTIAAVVSGLVPSTGTVRNRVAGP